jgi:hypothetical protein
MPAARFKPGQWVVYRKQKHSTSPGPRARKVEPAGRGETYTYVVDKFWVVQEVCDDGRLRLRTRRAKEHVVAPDDPQLRPASWRERWWFRERFLDVEQEGTSAPS